MVQSAAKGGVGVVDRNEEVDRSAGPVLEAHALEDFVAAIDLRLDLGVDVDEVDALLDARRDVDRLDRLLLRQRWRRKDGGKRRE